MTTFEHNLEKYAALTAKTGINVQSGDTIVIQIAVTQSQLARDITAACYDLGAAEVIIKWQDDLVDRLNMQHKDEDRLLNVPDFQTQEYDYWLEHGAKRISVMSSNPDNLKGLDSDRVAAVQKANGQAMLKVRQATQANKNSWIVIAAASPAWAHKVFPDDDLQTATDKLWTEIFKTTRIDQADPIKAWEAHGHKLQAKAAELNAAQFKALHYTAPGTDITIGLPENHIWIGGPNESSDGRPFVANMPTEEVFSAADANNINGYISSTKPLSYAGNTLNNMKFTFENGRVIKATAEEGNDVLQKLLQTDAGVKSLGEVALVPDPSPISQSKITFFNTLFDENASNHLALGSAYAFSIEGGTKMTEEQLKAAGLNRSQAHVDFMVGSSQMNIDGIKHDGSVVPVFRNGDWAD
ncbi:aminopeptidase [Latilactobacillus fuchuensis]|uniref:Aminopeptidase PepS n=1 Tax=Latilactobacillus fuchuensis TaxID=164393 RepID=A0A2N9DX29_9LACO|nr:aminopeptidase [Latilactobacillus fuchuensis]MCP8856775.1 aminopeptidase [Latilactobacillus fuchuensis]SPC39236.1 Aminopeptidase PepS [Latilactobacillus fuchuensis]